MMCFNGSGLCPRDLCCCSFMYSLCQSRRRFMGSRVNSFSRAHICRVLVPAVGMSYLLIRPLSMFSIPNRPRWTVRNPAVSSQAFASQVGSLPARFLVMLGWFLNRRVITVAHCMAFQYHGLSSISLHLHMVVGVSGFGCCVCSFLILFGVVWVGLVEQFCSLF